MTIPAGWYPDPAGPPGQRWWDGQRWTEQVSAPAAAYAPVPVLRAPEGTSPQTAWAWLIVVLPVLALVPLFTVDIGSIVARAFDTPALRDPGAVLAMTAQPGYIAVSLISLLTTVLSVVFGYLDWRALVRRGVPKPFHWAFSFLVLAVGTLPYLIGRDVILRRRTGRWSGAAWVAIGVVLASFIAVTAYVVVQVQSILLFFAQR